MSGSATDRTLLDRTKIKINSAFFKAIVIAYVLNYYLCSVVLLRGEQYKILE
jgi:hypothetical protein